MSKRIRKITDGGPVTKEGKDEEGKTKITINVKFITPFMARMADYATIATTGAIAMLSIGGAISIQEASPVQRLVITTLPLPAYIFAKYVFYNALSRTRLVAFTPETVGFSKGFKTHYFDRNLGVKFGIREHPKADLEATKIELRETKRKVRWYTRPIKPYYQKSYVLVLEYMGQPNIIAVIYGLENAQKIVARLTAVNEIIRSYGESAQGVATSPEQDWGKTAGGLSAAHNRSVS